MPTSSRTSRETAPSNDSPGSTKPAKQLYIGPWNCTPRASSALSPRVTSVIMAGAIRGNANSPHAGLLLRRCATPPAEPVGAGPLDKLHRATGHEPFGLARTAEERSEIDRR